MENGIPVVLRRRHRWVSPTTERRIEEAWGPSGPHRTCQVCFEECPSHRSLRLHVDAHFLLHFCPCGFHDVYPYPVTVHKLSCFAGENHTVDEDSFPLYLDAIKPVIRKAITLAALTSGFHVLLLSARHKSPMVQGPPPTPVNPSNTPEVEETTISRITETPITPPRPSQLANVEERLLRLQAEFTQLAPDLLDTTTGLYQLKDSVGRLKRRLRARQARHRARSLQEAESNQ